MISDVWYPHADPVTIFSYEFQPNRFLRFDWSLPHQAYNRFRGREVKGSSIDILTDRSLGNMWIRGELPYKSWASRLMTVVRVVL